MKKKYILILAMMSLMISEQAYTQTKQKEQSKQTAEMEQITPKGYTTFKVSDNVTMYKVSFKNQYKMDVAGHLFIPKNLDQSKKHSAIIIGHPMGAVKEQSANVYAANMAERGFVTLSLDLSFWGESEGKPRNAVAPDIYAEDFSAAVDFLGTRPFVNRNRTE
ncbi:alpha/beta hydrolase [Mastigocladopsis repens]|uniref:alpha/beta hydrolase n=1 Tax=Mastigocladopsis repens TaxID=221287 RepID=UPI0002F6D304|nr:alpha/beta hydrolase [Mastigocladopsis repens]